jgi:hypothetical protein
MDERPPPEEEALLMSMMAVGVYSLGRGDVPEGRTREITEKTTTPTAAIRVITMIITLRRQSTANRSMRDISSLSGFLAVCVSGGDCSVLVIGVLFSPRLSYFDEYVFARRFLPIFQK